MCQWSPRNLRLRTCARPSPRRARALAAITLIGGALAIWLPGGTSSPTLADQGRTPVTAASPSAPEPVVFNADQGATLPTHRVVAFYAVPGASRTGPAYVLTSSMLARLKSQGAAYQKLDPTHPVALGIDLVVSVPDRFRGGDGSYSHHVDAAPSRNTSTTASRTTCCSSST